MQPKSDTDDTVRRFTQSEINTKIDQIVEGLRDWTGVQWDFGHVWGLVTVIAMDDSIVDRLLELATDVRRELIENRPDGYDDEESWRKELQKKFVVKLVRDPDWRTYPIEREGTVSEEAVKSKQTGVKVKLIDEDGNAFAIMGRVVQAMHRAGISKETIDQYREEAMSGDYDHLLQTTLAYVEEEGESEEEFDDGCPDYGYEDDDEKEESDEYSD